MRVLIAGAGVVGLPAAGRIPPDHTRILCDFDRVETGNLIRQDFDAAHVGWLKVDAARDILLRRSPGADVRTAPCDVRRLGVGAFRSVDLVLGCVDNLAAEAHLARMCAEAGTHFVRLATRTDSLPEGAARRRPVGEAAVRFLPAPGPGDPCGLCSFKAEDHEQAADHGQLLAGDAAGCAAGAATHPDAGALIFAEHGAIAAAMAADAILAGEIGPARIVRFTSGLRPAVSTFRLTRSPTCVLDGWHGALQWTELSGTAASVRLAPLLAEARDRLGRGTNVVFDTPLCTWRACGSCSEPYDPGFLGYGPAAPLCARCGEPVRQDLRTPEPAAAIDELRWAADRTFAELGAPNGGGLRFRAPDGRQWNVHLAADVPFTEGRVEHA